MENCVDKIKIKYHVWGQGENGFVKHDDIDEVLDYKPVKNDVIQFMPPSYTRTAYVAHVKKVDRKNGRVSILVLNPDKRDDFTSIDLGITRDPYHVMYSALPEKDSVLGQDVHFGSTSAMYGV